MTALRVAITSTEYRNSNFAYYEIFASTTNLAIAAVESTAEYHSIAFSTQFLLVGLTPGEIWYTWIRGVYANSTIPSDLTALGPKTVDAIGTVQLADQSVTYAKIQNVSATDRVLGRQTAGAGTIEEITCTAAGRALIAGANAAAQRTTLGAGAASGLATLDGSTLVPVAQLPALSDLSGQVTLAQLPSIADGKILSNISGGSAVPAANSLSSLIDTFSSTRGSVLYRGSSAWAALGPGTSGQVLQSGGAGADPSWASSGGTGTVTSVALALPSFITVSGSPVTSSGTLTGTLATQSANLVLAGPTTGSAAAPTFRSLVGADLPNPGASSLGGVQSKASTSHQFLTQISTSGVVSAAQPAHADLSDYEEGTWTPSEYYGAFSWTSTRGRFRKHGKSLVFNGYFNQAVTQASATQARLAGLPYSCLNLDVFAFPGGSSIGAVVWYLSPNTAYCDLFTPAFVPISLSAAQNAGYYVGGVYQLP